MGVTIHDFSNLRTFCAAPIPAPTPSLRTTAKLLYFDDTAEFQKPPTRISFRQRLAGVLRRVDYCLCLLPPCDSERWAFRRSAYCSANDRLFRSIAMPPKKKSSKGKKVASAQHQTTPIAAPSTSEINIPQPQTTYAGDYMPDPAYHDYVPDPAYLGFNDYMPDPAYHGGQDYVPDPAYLGFNDYMPDPAYHGGQTSWAEASWQTGGGTNSYLPGDANLPGEAEYSRASTSKKTSRKRPTTSDSLKELKDVQGVQAVPLTKKETRERKRQRPSVADTVASDSASDRHSTSGSMDWSSPDLPPETLAFYASGATDIETFLSQTHVSPPGDRQFRSSSSDHSMQVDNQIYEAQSHEGGILPSGEYMDDGTTTAGSPRKRSSIAKKGLDFVKRQGVKLGKVAGGISSVFKGPKSKPTFSITEDEDDLDEVTAAEERQKFEKEEKARKASDRKAARERQRENDLMVKNVCEEIHRSGLHGFSGIGPSSAVRVPLYQTDGQQPSPIPIPAEFVTYRAADGRFVSQYQWAEMVSVEGGDKIEQIVNCRTQDASSCLDTMRAIRIKVDPKKREEHAAYVRTTAVDIDVVENEILPHLSPRDEAIIRKLIAEARKLGLNTIEFLYAGQGKPRQRDASHIVPSTRRRLRKTLVEMMRILLVDWGRGLLASSTDPAIVELAPDEAAVKNESDAFETEHAQDIEHVRKVQLDVELDQDLLPADQVTASLSATSSTSSLPSLSSPSSAPGPRGRKGPVTKLKAKMKSVKWPTIRWFSDGNIIWEKSLNGRRWGHAQMVIFNTEHDDGPMRDLKEELLIWATEGKNLNLSRNGVYVAPLLQSKLCNALAAPIFKTKKALLIVRRLPRNKRSLPAQLKTLCEQLGFQGELWVIPLLLAGDELTEADVRRVARELLKPEYNVLLSSGVQVTAVCTKVLGLTPWHPLKHATLQIVPNSGKVFVHFPALCATYYRVAKDQMLRIAHLFALSSTAAFFKSTNDPSYERDLQLDSLITAANYGRTDADALEDLDPAVGPRGRYFEVLSMVPEDSNNGVPLLVPIDAKGGQYIISRPLDELPVKVHYCRCWRIYRYANGQTDVAVVFVFSMESQRLELRRVNEDGVADTVIWWWCYGDLCCLEAYRGFLMLAQQQHLTNDLAAGFGDLDVGTFWGERRVQNHQQRLDSDSRNLTISLGAAVNALLLQYGDDMTSDKLRRSGIVRPEQRQLFLNFSISGLSVNCESFTWKLAIGKVSEKWGLYVVIREEKEDWRAITVNVLSTSAPCTVYVPEDAREDGQHGCLLYIIALLKHCGCWDDAVRRVSGGTDGGVLGVHGDYLAAIRNRDSTKALPRTADQRVLD
ncbi:hypothetical protein C8F01DRAFT_304978 [Mycena amicta]|nr:hypothetical protein C8F01DRAFT_304978 [Mycena amicta]